MQSARSQTESATPGDFADRGGALPRDYTVSDLAERWGCKPHVVLALIKDRELEAINIRPGAKRPRWRIPPSALQAFMQRQSSFALPDQPAPRRKKEPATPSLIDPKTGKLAKAFRKV